MELVAFSVQGYRRFVKKTSVKLHGDLIAIVGPNEAGKSSLLRALAHLHDKEPFEHHEQPRRSSSKPRLAWHFLLEESDKEALAGIHDSEHVERLVLTKTADARRTWDFMPRNPKRSRVSRQALLEILGGLRDESWIQEVHDAEECEFTLDELHRAIELLESDPDDLSNEQIAELRLLAQHVVDVNFDPGQDEEAADTIEEPAGVDDDESEEAVDEASRDRAVESIERVCSEESERSPWRQSVEALRSRLPQIEVFGEEDRQLAGEYDLLEVADAPPSALMHLAHLAGLNLRSLRDEATAGAISDVATRRNAANRRLLDEFDKSWNQQGIAVQIDVQGTILHIQATTPEDEGLSPIRERSDGLRWFAALLAFSHGWKERPILLVDEIETHLHYDAQADLVGVLAQQLFTSKVVYTTHSFGCLPYDLGTGVRVVDPINAAESRLENGFWRDGAGFSPLLVSMGAAAMSFTPTRLAVIAEGPADAVLLPSVFRQAADLARMPFQVAPGLSVVAPDAVGGLDSEAGKVAYLVDGDKGGSMIADKLVDAGIDRARVVQMEDEGHPLETEDLVSSSIYVSAVNDELRCWNTITTEFQESDVAANLRTKALEDWCDRHNYGVPDKVAVAQRVVDLAGERSLVESSRVGLINGFLERLAKLLDVKLVGRGADGAEDGAST